MTQAAGADRINLLLVEDNRLLREGLTAMINRQPDLRVVAALENGEDVLRQVQELMPQVVLLDLGPQQHNSLRVVESIKKQCPHVKLVVMDLIPTQADLVDFIKAGVSGFLLKEATFEDFLMTVRRVAGGTNVLPHGLIESLFTEIVDRGLRRQPLALPPEARLTKREHEIMELIADGLSNKEIAARLNLATFTVKSHVHNILEKLALRTRLQVASYYARSIQQVVTSSD